MVSDQFSDASLIPLFNESTCKQLQYHSTQIAVAHAQTPPTSNTHEGGIVWCVCVYVCVGVFVFLLNECIYESACDCELTDIYELDGPHLFVSIGFKSHCTAFLSMPPRDEKRSTAT
jgi:hypothetical protein